MVRTPFLQHLARTGADHMVSLKQMLVLFEVLAFGVMASAFAQEQEVRVTASRLGCEGMSSNDSSKLAREAEKKGLYQEAAECFLAAGEAATVAKRNASTAASSAKSQLARMKAAFR